MGWMAINRNPRSRSICVVEFEEKGNSPYKNWSPLQHGSLREGVVRPPQNRNE